MRRVFSFAILIVIAIGLAFFAMVAIYQRDAPGSTFMERATNLVMEMTGTQGTSSTKSEAGAPAPAVQDTTTALTPEMIAALTAAIRAELQQEARANDKNQFWSDVGVSAIFMLLGAMFGELRGLLGLTRR